MTELEPTSRGDMIAELMRSWYEKNRESWWERHKPSAPRKGEVADGFMYDLTREAVRIVNLDDERLCEEHGGKR